MKKDLVILGAGPRGLSVAIQALKYKDRLNIYLIDPRPISTWEEPHMVPNMMMRSPITFDLVTFQKDLQEYSLSNFLRFNLPYYPSQAQVELNEQFCSRKEFVDYLKFCLNKLIEEGVTLINKPPSLITKDKVILPSTTINYHSLVIATGKYTEEIVVPNYLNKDSIYICKDIYCSDWYKKNVYIIGSGQFSAELVDYVTDNYRASIKWVRTHNIKVEQYPVPSYKNWGKLTALGLHYKNNLSLETNRKSYLKKVKSWGPTITPHINKSLKDKKHKFKIINPEEIKLSKDNVYILASGRKPNLYKLPFDFRFTSGLLKENTAKLNNNFSAVGHPNIYFTGLLALEAGGPCQGSIISSGNTSKTILDSVVSFL